MSDLTRCPECNHAPSMDQCVIVLKWGPLVQAGDRCGCTNPWHGENHR